MKETTPNPRIRTVAHSVTCCEWLIKASQQRDAKRPIYETEATCAEGLATDDTIKTGRLFSDRLCHWHAGYQRKSCKTKEPDRKRTQFPFSYFCVDRLTRLRRSPILLISF